MTETPNVTNAARARILLVEDDSDDVLVLGGALRESEAIEELDVVSDGVEALQFLYGKRPFENAVRPDLILLDLNLPRKTGHEVLAEIRDDPDLADLPVIVLTTSQADSDVAESYRLGVNAYVAKPFDSQDLDEIVRLVERFWSWLLVQRAESNERA